MARKGRLLAALLMSAICGASLVGAVACGGGGEEDAKKYTVTYTAGASDATGEEIKVSYDVGQPFALEDTDTFTRAGYTFTQWHDGTSFYDAGAMYTMPAHDVTFTAQWEKEASQEAPEGSEQISDFPTGALVTSNGTAKVNWLASYEVDGVKVTAWVEDKTVYTDSQSIYAKDGVEVIFAPLSSRNGYTANTISVSVAADGSSLVREMATGDEAVIDGLKTEAKYLTLDGKALAGYRVSITMPYEAIGVTQEAKNATVALGTTNAAGAGTARTIYDSTFGTDAQRVNSYILIKDNDTFAENRYLQGGATWGNAGTLTAEDVWDLENDDGTKDAHIEMTGTSGDNFIYMREAGKHTNFYAEVQLSVTEVCRMPNGNFDGYPKFGMTLFNENSSKGVFYFVDAVDGTPADGVINADSVSIGHNIRSAGQWGGAWTIDGNLGAGKTSDAYQKGNYITLGIYRQGSAVRLLLDGKSVAVVRNIGIGAEDVAYIGLASFNLKLSAKNYSITTDAEALKQYEIDGVVTEDKRPPIKTIDASLADWTDEEKANPFIIPSADGSSVTVYATKDANGINIFYDVYHKEHKTTERDWFLNTNVEFRLAGDASKQYAMAANGFKENVEYGAMNTQEDTESGLYHTVAEIFIPYSETTGYGASSKAIPAIFYFKVGGMYGNPWYTGDWWRADDGNDKQGTYITEKGILTGTEKTIDGSDADWADASFKTSGRSRWAAKLGDDGLYVIVKLTADSIAPDRVYVSGADGTQEQWWLNQNVEVQENEFFRRSMVIFMNGKAYHTGYITDAAAVYTAGEGQNKDELVFEFFIANENFKTDASALNAVKLKMGGQLFATRDETGNAFEVYADNVDVVRPSYTVTFEDGAASTPVYVKIGSAIGELPQAAGKTGFTFDGWYVEDTKIDASYVPTDNVTATARYTPVAPTVNFDGNGGTGTAPTASPAYVEAEEHYTLTLPAECPYTNAGFAFSKWQVEVAGIAGATEYDAGATVVIAPGSTVTIKATWLEEGAQNYTVTFELGYAEAPEYNETRVVTGGGTLSALPTDPERSGYRFDGWKYDGQAFTTETVVNGNITVTASWVKRVTVTFSAGYATATETFDPVTVDEGKTVSLPTPAARGTYLTFAGWFYGEGLTSKLEADTQVTQDIAATAKWEVTKEQKALDQLFIGDSFFDITSFWYTYAAQFGGDNSASIAVGGTKVGYWLEKLSSDVLLQYAPEKIVIHIGINDVNDGGRSDEAVKADLGVLFAGLKEVYPTAQIYYVSIVKNVLFKQNTATYASINAWVKEQADINYIDFDKFITTDETGTAHQQWFNLDGLHPGVNGYGVLNREIVKALGLSYTETGAGLGDTTVADSPNYAHTAGWKYDQSSQIWHHENEGKSGMEQLMISDAYASTLFAEAKISVAGMYNGERFGKAGIAIASPKAVYFFYINLSQDANADGMWDDNYGSLAYREEQKGFDWVYPESNEGAFRPFGGNGYVPLGSEAYDHNISPEAYKTLGVAKMGKALYFFSSGNLVGTLEDSLFGADEKVTVSVFGFNTNMYARAGRAVTTEEGVNDVLAPYVPLKTIDGSLADWTAEEKANPVVIPGAEGRKVTVYAALDDRGVNVFYDVYHKAYVPTHAEWFKATNLEMRLGNTDYQYYVSANGTSRGVKESYMHTTEPAEDGLYHTVAELFVPYVGIDGGGFNKNSTAVPAMFAFLTPGEGQPIWAQTDFWFSSNTEEHNNLITRNGLKTGTEKTIDGSDADWADAAFTTNGRAQYATKLGADGLYVIVKLTQDNIATDRHFYGDKWWLNQNIEIGDTANFGVGHISIVDGKAYTFRGVSAAAASFVEGTGADGDTLIVEFFIANEIMKGNVTADTQSVVFRMGGQLFADSTSEENVWQQFADNVTITRTAE